MNSLYSAIYAIIKFRMLTPKSMDPHFCFAIMPFLPDPKEKCRQRWQLTLQSLSTCRLFSAASGLLSDPGAGPGGVPEDPPLNSVLFSGPAPSSFATPLSVTGLSRSAEDPCTGHSRLHSTKSYVLKSLLCQS